MLLTEMLSLIVKGFGETLYMTLGSTLVAEMVLHTGAPASIVFADTRTLNGRFYGQMILQLPEDDETMEKMMGFLRQAEVSFEEVI